MRDGIWTVELRSRLAGRHLAANLAKSPNLTFIHRSCLTDDHKRRERCEEQLVQVQANCLLEEQTTSMVLPQHPVDE